LAIRRGLPSLPTGLPEEAPRTGCHRGDSKGFGFGPRGLLWRDVSSPAVRISRRSRVSADHRTAAEFLPGLPALQKPVSIFEFQQEHSLDLAAARTLPRSLNANVNFRRFLFKDSNVNLRSPRCCLDECFLLFHAPCDIAIVTECLLFLLRFRPNRRWKRCNIQLLDHKLSNLLAGNGRIIPC